ncbi:MAG: hypothetical protein LBM06_04200 [Prevotellaceae bacterium]|jgi:predicted extracellular nuclease|nr:hypothetical protein [Prevotellaceae bacterium]
MKPFRLFLLLLFTASAAAQQPVVFPDDFRTGALDGKTVTITNTLTLTNNYSFASGSVTFSAGTLWTPTEKHLPSAAMFEQQNAANAANQLFVRRGNFSFTDADGTCRIGQTATSLTGTLRQSGDRYTLTLTRAPQLVGNPRPTSCEQEGSNLKVVSFNLEHFNADSLSYQVKAQKLLAAFEALHADIYAVCEVEGILALENLCTKLNQLFPADDYRTEAYDDNRTGMCCFLYNNAVVAPVGTITQNKLASNYLPQRKVALGFRLRANDERFIVCMNHWKSKAGTNVPDAYQDKGDGQGAYNPRRVQEAEATLKFLQTICTVYDDPDVLLVGDLNAYSQEDPVRLLTRSGALVNQLQRYAPNEYSYAYYSNNSYAVGYLDHSLTTASLDTQVLRAVPFRINADEPSRLDIGSSGVQANNMYRCSDHNPIVTFLRLDTSTGTTSPAQAATRMRILSRPQKEEIAILCPDAFAPVRVNVWSIDGRLLLSVPVENKDAHRFTMSVGQLPSGFYLLVAQDGEGRNLTEKFGK